MVVGGTTKSTIYNATTLSFICDYNHGGLTLLSLKFVPSRPLIVFGFENDNVKIVSSTNCTQVNSFSTGHAKVYDVDFNMNGSKMVTCGDDKKFRVWNISTLAFLTSTPPIIGGEFDCGEVVLSCKLSY